MGCSRLQFLHNLLPGYIERNVNSYLDMTSSDQELLKNKTYHFVSWHKTIMLPRYARFLEGQANLIAKDQLSSKTITMATDNIRTLMGEVTAGAAPFIASILIQHTSVAKTEYFRERLEQNLEEKLEEIVELGKELNGERATNIVTRIEKFTGNLTKKQKEIVYYYVKDTEKYPRIWIEIRRKRNSAVIDFLSSQPSESIIQKFITKKLFNFNELEAPIIQKVIDEWWSRFSGFLVDLLYSLDTRQRKLLSTSLQTYAADISNLTK